MEKISDRKRVLRLSALFCLIYFTSYITRINYGAIISEMVTSMRISKQLLSLSLTGSFITYGVGQIISGYLGDKVQPKTLIFAGLVVSSSMNILIPFCPNVYYMIGTWCINGFAQAFMWPPLVRYMSAIFNESDYRTASLIVSWGSSFGTIFVYLASPFIIIATGWKGVFFFCAALGLIVSAVWRKISFKIDDAEKNQVEALNKKEKFLSPMVLIIMVVIVLQGMLRDGVTTWMPTYISETFNLSNFISILTGVLLPVFSIICFKAAQSAYRKIENPMSCAGIFFGLGGISALLLFLCAQFLAGASVILSAVLTGAMHGVNLIIICMVPPFFKYTGKVSLVSGILNSCTYVGSAVSTYGIALVSENYGWSVTIFVWFVIAFLGTALCFLCAKPWQKRFM